MPEPQAVKQPRRPPEPAKARQAKLAPRDFGGYCGVSTALTEQDTVSPMEFQSRTTVPIISLLQCEKE